MDDNYLMEFNDYIECAKYLDTTKDVIKTFLSRNKKGIVRKKRDKKNKRWVKLISFKLNERDKDK